MTGERIEIDLAAPPERVSSPSPVAPGRSSNSSTRALAGLGSEEMCTKGWSHHVAVSLKGLVELGEAAAGPGAGSD
jgi:hypothetical protein